MCLRWTTAGMLEAERQSRRVISYAGLAKPVTAIERGLDRQTVPPPTVNQAVMLVAT
jgi:hypothetical protein